MTKVFCPLKGDWTSDSNREHVVARSIGGTLAVQVPADRETNRRLGAEVDAYLSSSDLARFLLARQSVVIDAEPIEFPLPLTSPSLLVEGDTHRLDLARMRARAILGNGGLRIESEVNVDMVLGPDGIPQGYIATVSGSDLAENDAKLEELRAGITHHRMIRRLGKEIDLSRDLDHDQAQLRVSLVRPLSFEMKSAIVVRSLAKTALGACAERFGGSWSQSVFADALRRVVEGDVASGVCDPLGLQAWVVPNDGAFYTGAGLARGLPLPTSAFDVTWHEVGFHTSSDGCVYCEVIFFGVLLGRFRVHNTLHVPAGGFRMDFKDRALFTRF